MSPGHRGPADPQATDWDLVPDRLRAHGLRWTAQRRTLLGVLAATEGHVTASRLVERCRELDPETTPSTVYRTLDALERAGILRHSHGIDGREEFHVRPATDHGHLLCEACGAESELAPADARPFLTRLSRSHGFEAHIGHLTVVGRCRACSSPAGDAAGE